MSVERVPQRAVERGDRVGLAVLEHPDAAETDGGLGIDLGIGLGICGVEGLRERIVRGAHQTPTGQLRLRQLQEQSRRGGLVRPGACSRCAEASSSAAASYANRCETALAAARVASTAAAMAS